MVYEKFNEKIDSYSLFDMDVFVGHFLRVLGCSLITMVTAVGGQHQTIKDNNLTRTQNRCGWISNPTPANISLYDREGEWIIGIQGGHQAEGDLPDFGRQWVKTNGDYGYGCGCLMAQVDKKSRDVIKIVTGHARPLSVCRHDRALKHWGFK